MSGIVEEKNATSVVEMVDEKEVSCSPINQDSFAVTDENNRHP